MSPLRSLFVAAAAVAALAAVAAPPKRPDERSFPRSLDDGPGQSRIMLPATVTTGTFDGTWMYVNRDVHFAMWIRTEDGRPRVKLQFQSLASPEAFETDWNGVAKYYMSGHPVTFDLKITAADVNRIAGSWLWDVETPTTGRREEAQVVLQRTGYGRTLLMDFRNYAKTLRHGNDARTARVPVAWNWQKISKREIRWDEMPW